MLAALSALNHHPALHGALQVGSSQTLHTHAALLIVNTLMPQSPSIGHVATAEIWSASHASGHMVRTHFAEFLTCRPGIKALSAMQAS